MEIITASCTLPMTNGAPIIEKGAIAIELSKIYAFGSLEEIRKKYPNAEVISYENSVLMPGLINAHCHLDLIDFYDTSFNDTEYVAKSNDFIKHIISSIEFKNEMIFCDIHRSHNLTIIQQKFIDLLEKRKYDLYRKEYKKYHQRQVY